MSDVAIPQAEFLAHHAVSRAIDDEIALRGSTQITESLMLYLEFRVAEVVRAVMPDSPRRFDA